MKIIVTGSSGHLGEALMRTLRAAGHEALGVDISPSPFTDAVGSITNREFMRHWMHGIEAVLHAATLHKPQVATHSRQDFLDTNITGTLVVLEEAVRAGVASVVFTSTTSTFGAALIPAPGLPAAWITEAVAPVPKNIYGATKVAAEDLCQLVQRDTGLPCIVLRTSRFFPEADDDPVVRNDYPDANVKANEFLFRRVDLEDVVDAHLAALRCAPALGFGRFIISATTPFAQSDLAELRTDAPRVLKRIYPQYEAEYSRRGWRMFARLDRVYVNTLAREKLGWQPRHDFSSMLGRLKAGEDLHSPIARLIGAKGYQPEAVHCP